MSEWIYIGEIDTLPKTSTIHCDTRDFHITCPESEGDKEYVHKVRKNLRRSGRNLSSCTIPHSEIIPLLKDLESRSGGRGDWRMITTQSYKAWLKYIRFIEVLDESSEEPKYIVYTNVGDTYTPINLSTFKEPIDQESLNFIPDRENLFKSKK